MTLVEFRDTYPEFDDVPDTVLQRQLDAFASLYQGNYGDLSEYLTGLYVAHQVTVFSTNTSQAPVQTVNRRSVDGMSWSYDKSSASDKAGDFASTKYGLEFHRLMSLFGKGPVMAKAAL